LRLGIGVLKSSPEQVRESGEGVLNLLRAAPNKFGNPARVRNLLRLIR